jgi:WD40 repeat protein
MTTFIRNVGVILLTALAAPMASFAASEPAEGNKPKLIPIANVQHAGPVDFEKDILPFLSTSCLACHNKSKPKAGLILETPAEIRKGGDDGLVIKPGKSAESLLLKAASHAPDVDSPMPPPNNKVAAPDLTSEQLGLIRLWIDQGATGEVHASLVPVKWQAMPAILDPIFAVAVSPDGRFAAAGRGNRIDVYDLPTSKLSAHLSDPALTSAGPDAAHRDMVESLAFSPDGNTLASGSYREVKFWKRSSAGEKIALGDKPALCAAASPDGKLIATGSEDGTIRLFDPADAKSVGELTGHSAALVSLAFSADNSKLLSVAKNMSVRVWLVANRKLYCKVEPAIEPRCAAWLGNATIAVGSAEGVTTYPLPTSAEKEVVVGKVFKDAVGPVVALVSLNDEAHLLAAREDGTVNRISVGSGSVRPLLKHGSPVTLMAIRPDSKRLVTVGTDNVARVWTIEDGKMVAELKGDPALASRIARADRAAALAKTEVAYRKDKIDTYLSQVKASAERMQKAKEAFPDAQKALAEAQKSFDAAKAAADAADQANKDKKESLAKDFAAATDELKKAKDAKAALTDQGPKFRQAVDQAEAEVASAQRKVGAAQTAVEAASGKADEKKEAAAKDLAAAQEGFKKATAARAAAAERLRKSREASASADKALDTAQRNLNTSRQARDNFDNARDDKKEAAIKAFTKADDDLRKAKNAMNAADDEVKLSGRGSEDSTAALAAAKSAYAAAGDWLKLRDKEAADVKKTTADTAKPIRAVAFSADGAQIATAGDDAVVHTWSSEKGAAGEMVEDGSAPLVGVAFAGSDRVVACTAAAPPAILKPSSTWKLVRTIGNSDSTSPFADRVVSLDFSPDGHQLITGGGIPSRGGEIRLFNADTGDLTKSFDDVHSDTVLCVRFSPDGSKVASAGADRFVRLLDLATGKVLRALEGHAGHALAVAWSHDGHMLASGGADNTLRFWDAETGERGKIVAGFDKEVTAVTFVGDSAQAAAVSGDGKVRLVNAAGSDVRSFPGATGFQYSLAVSTDGATIAAGGQDGILRIWNGTTGTATGTFDPGK